MDNWIIGLPKDENVFISIAAPPGSDFCRFREFDMLFRRIQRIGLRARVPRFFFLIRLIETDKMHLMFEW
jgi:hypothetical protein